MIGVEVDVSGFDDDVQGWLLQFGQDGKAGAAALGEKVKGRAKQFCPLGETGRLRASIETSEGSDGEGVYIDVGTDVEYAPFVEWGTSKMSAQPYMRPAFAEAAVADFPLRKTI